MMRPTAEELHTILAAHKEWLDSDGKNGARAYLEGAYLEGANLEGANLARAYLEGAYLADANLARANLEGAYLKSADLADANLEGANLARAYLEDAYLKSADLEGANLADANLARANLEGAYLKSADLEGAAAPVVPVVEHLNSQILAAVDGPSAIGALDMSQWHTCDTTHCMAGWAVHLAGKPGYELERQVGPHMAGVLIFRASTGRAPHFFAPNDRALAELRKRAAEESDDAVEVAP